MTCFVGGSGFSTSLIPAVSNADVLVGDRHPAAREHQQSPSQCGQRSSSSDVVRCVDKCSVERRRKAGTCHGGH